MSLNSLVDWFAGNGRYMTLWHCMDHDRFWVGLTVTLDLSVACGYLLIAAHWWKSQKSLSPDNPARAALGRLRNIFLFCGLCGYIFIPVKVFWPAWRLYDAFMVVLVYTTWRYALSTRNLSIVYTELNRSRQLAIDLEASREQSKKKSFFLNAVSHDLRTPLNGLVLQTAVAEMSLAQNDPAMLRESLSQMKITAKVAADLLNSFLELAKLDWTQEKLTVADFSLADLMKDITSRAKPEADRKHIELRPPSLDGQRIRTDRIKLTRILDNLITNAVKFTDAGHVDITCASGNGQHQFTVADTGVGIEPDHMKFVFDEFYQVKNSERNHTKGFGLGLAIARRLADQLNAKILVDSTPGKGSKFTLVLRDAIDGQN